MPAKKTWKGSEGCKLNIVLTSTPIIKNIILLDKTVLCMF